MTGQNLIINITDPDLKVGAIIPLEIQHLTSHFSLLAFHV